jgi:hypothetical protein
VGPDAGTIHLGSIRNVAQLIVADSQGKIVAFDQRRREKDVDNVTLTARDLEAGETYHFLLLMGHWQYKAENNKYKYDEYNDAPPTLLAAGFTSLTLEPGYNTLVIKMKPLVVDTVFTYGASGITLGAALPATGEPLVTLPQGTPASLTWKVISDITPLIDAHKVIPAGGDKGVTITWDDHWFNGITTKGEGLTQDSPVLSGTYSNEITQSLNTATVMDGHAYFNLKYAPFGITDKDVWNGYNPEDMTWASTTSGFPQWIIRNGVNDDPQDEDTSFPKAVTQSNTDPWFGTGKNGNGAVVFSVKSVLDLTPYIAMPVQDALPTTSLFTGNYGGPVTWTPSDSRFEAGVQYTAQVKLTAVQGFTFDGVPAKLNADEVDGAFTHNGGTVTHQAGSGTTIDVIIVFPEIAGKPITDVDLTDYLPAPVEGMRPVSAFVESATQYTAGSVSWNPGHGTFLADREYKATVTLTAAAGYTFTGMKSRFFHAEGNISVLSGSSGTIVLDIAFRRLSPIPVIGATWYVAETGDDNNSGTSATEPLKTIKKALEKAAVAKASLNGKTAEIVLLSDITPTDVMKEKVRIDDAEHKGFIVIDASHPPILLRSQSSQTPLTVLLEEGDHKILITVEAGATLTLKHITLQGPGAGPDGNGYTSITLILTLGDLVLESGASVKDGKKSNGGGTGGVHISGGGTFTMNKGTISGNKSGNLGGGVRVDNMLDDEENVKAVGTFTMYGGSIRDNTSNLGAGVTVFSGSQFTMYGGVISDNKADDGGGVVVWDSGSQFTMNGGSIRGNSAVRPGGGGGVGVFNGEGGGSQFTMNGGVISGNKAGNGSGVFVDNNTQFTKTGGVIYGSDADNDFKNTVIEGKGHAVYVSSTPAKKRDSTAYELDTLDSSSEDDWE